ncbi:MAG: flagellar assembly protein FliW [Phycisphaerales bacterium]|nr:flagellar assembly protein FliW [Phycisphaerales bacterium]
MDVRTTRFGTVNIAEDRIITFPKGLLGFSSFTKFCLLEPADDACFFWLQSIEEPSLAFVVTDPAFFVPEFTVPIRPEQMGELKLDSLGDAQVFIIVNKVDQTLTGNMQGPLVINTLSRVGEQFVLAEKRWTTRHPLMRVASGSGAQQAAASA